ncbi:MAG: ABC transporter ATP-binding protein [Verrucomicrobia bacterium]|nr:ABC transporter ATP-binding protein [Verrucomicrobiota bacterium]
MSNVLSVDKLKKLYLGKKPFLAVDEISFHLKQGEILGLLGPNGSGKTTTIQMLLGTLEYTSGTITYFGLDFSKHRSKILESVSFASTYTSLPYIMTVQENLDVFGRLYGLKKQVFRKRADELLERFGIFEKKHTRISSLSAGQVTRLMLVKAFFIEPKIVLLDEPTASLDPDIAREVCEFLLEQRERTGFSILFTSHKMEEAMQLCDRTVFLKEGKIIADDLPKNLAKTVSSCRLYLVVQDGMKRTAALAEEKGHSYQIENRTIQVALDEKQIPSFLGALTQKGIEYTNIKIEEPSLEDYFLHIAKRKNL